MTASASIASLLVPSAPSAVGRSVASAAEATPDMGFESFLREAQAEQAAATNTADAARDVAPAPAAVTPPDAASGTSPVTPTAVPAPESPLPSKPVATATDQPPSTDEALQDPSLALPVMPGFLPVAAPGPAATTTGTSEFDPASGAQAAPVAATSASAVQAQVLATQGATAGLVTPASPQPSSASTGDTPATDPQAQAAAASLDAGQLAELAALAPAAGKAAATDEKKAPRQPIAGAGTPDAPASLTPQPAIATNAQAPSIAQGSGNNLTKDALQQVSPTATDAARSADPQAPQAAGTAPATTANFAVELRQATATPHGATPTLHVPLEALAVNIARKVDQGLNQFEISLTPVELGKLDISLKIGDDGRVHAVLRAERQDTLDLLRQDARTLENQLRQAGLDVGSNALSFQLSQGQAHRYKSALQGQFDGTARNPEDRSTDAISTTFIASRRTDGVDIHV